MKTIYVVDWGNGFFGYFDGETLMQIENTRSQFFTDRIKSFKDGVCIRFVSYNFINKKRKDLKKGKCCLLM